MDSLFDIHSPQAFDRDRLRDRLNGLARRHIYLGCSSWKYEGWLDQIYSRSRYQTRGRSSKKLFEETCLSEYSTVFPTVCGDFAFYQFPPEAFWAKLFRQTPPEFRWAFKIPEQITIPAWPMHPRYGALAGLNNPTFLDVPLLSEAFLGPLEPYRQHVGVLIFEFGTSRLPVREFVSALDPFLSALPAGWRYAVEVRNADFLTPLYFDCLRARDVTHVYNAWSRMPEIKDQMAMPQSQTADLLVVRALLKRGRVYEEAVKTFAPYDRLQEVNESAREGLRDVLHIAEVDGRPAFVFVNNRLEGNSPATIAAIVD